MSVEVTAAIGPEQPDAAAVHVSAVAASEAAALQLIRAQLPPGWRIRTHTVTHTPGGAPPIAGVGPDGLRF